MASVENESDHPLAKSVVDFIGDTKLYPVEKTNVIKGGGIVAQVEGHSVAIGNVALMDQEGIHLSEQALSDIKRFEADGNSLVLTSVDGELKALIGIRDQVRPGVKEDLAKIKKLGVKNLVVLSGDNQGTVDRVSRELGLTEAHGHMLPEDKSAYIKNLIDKGHTVAFVGDGVNDADNVARMGNFHVTNVTPNESWVTVGECLPANRWRGDLLLGRIHWAEPNRLV